MSQLHSLIAEYKELFKPELGIQQCSDEVEQLIEFFGERKFNNIVEIGSDEGGSIWLYAQLFASPEAIITIVDLAVKPVLQNVIKTLKERLPDAKFVTIEGSSHHVYLRNFDFIHIDGDHSYEAAKHDFESTWPFLLPGGFAVLHDTMLWEGTIQLREELEKEFQTKTFKGHNLVSGHFGKEGDNLSTGITVVFNGIQEPGKGNP